MLYPEENNGLIDVSFIPSPELFTAEDINRPVFIPNAASLAQAEYGQIGRGANSENVVSYDNAFEDDALNYDNTADTAVDKDADGKYNDSEQSNFYKDYEKSRSNNMLSVFTSFEDYKAYKERIDNELAGLTTVDGVEIKSQSKHFIERVFGTWCADKST